MVMDALASLSHWAFPIMLVGIPLYGLLKGVKVYEVFVEGAIDGFWLALKILPYLVGIFVAFSVFRASGALDILVSGFSIFTGPLGIPAEVVPLMFIRPISGSGALGITAELMRKWGPDSFTGFLASTLQGSTDTTFYIITLYFGAVGVKRTRHALPVALLGDMAAFLAAVAVCHSVFI
jgi:spore maturation protein B